MYVWDIPVERLCELHAEAEHRSIHEVIKQLNAGEKDGFYPIGVKRWKGRLSALASRHDRLIEHAKGKGWLFAQGHDSEVVGSGDSTPILYAVDSVTTQVKKLKRQACECELKGMPGA